MEALNIKGKLLARGRTAEIYALDEGRILKLFYAWCPAVWVEREWTTGRIISSMPVSAPKILDQLEINGRQGIVYERVHGPSMLKLATGKPWLLCRYARQLAGLQSEIHRLEGRRLPSLRASLTGILEQSEAVPDELRKGLLRCLEKLPDGKALCHFDFHPDQVLVPETGPVIIDWMTARQGHPLADVARSCIIMHYGEVPGNSRVQNLLINTWRRFFLHAYMVRYLDLHPGTSKEEILRWMVPVAAARLDEKIAGEREPILRFINSRLSRS